MGIRRIPKQLVFLMLAVFAGFPVTAGDCLNTMGINPSSSCIKDRAPFPLGYGYITGLRLTNFWKLDAGSIHPPLRLPQLKIDRLVMESLWGLRPGETLIGDPQWGAVKRQPDLDAIAALRARETAIASSRIDN